MAEYQWPREVKRTKQRETVLHILERCGKPLNATDIFMQAETSGAKLSLSTVYRILELFVEKGVAAKTAVLDDEMAYYELAGPTHKHYAVCVGCHKIVELDNCPMADFTPKLKDSDFHVLGHRVEMYGYCKDCDKKR